jgi:hypothetical protein
MHLVRGHLGLVAGIRRVLAGWMKKARSTKLERTIKGPAICSDAV